ncbi:MAG TPA: glycoside hydrolase family 15 protein [Thermodesulfobacteriota bacterium]|nr:glycoside hydrolase family 15 protein [Thermodesulfobacteriota bacterium]
MLWTFWLVNVLTLSGRVEEAERILPSILEYVSPLGLLAEEIDTKSHEQLVNFPQAFSHIGLINSALYLGMARGKKQIGPEPAGTGSRRA